MVYILMLLWQHTQFQIAIIQEWLPLYLILSKHCPLPKGQLGELVQYGHCICLKWDESFHPIQSNRYPGPRGFLLFFIGKFCDVNRFFYFYFCWHEALRAMKRKPLVETVGNLTFMPSAFDRF